MVAFIIFWAAVFASLFFLLGVIFKALASVVNYALQASAASMVPIIGLFSAPILLVIALLILYGVVIGIKTGEIWSAIGYIILIFIIIGIVAALFGWLGALLLTFAEIVVLCAMYIIGFVSIALEWLANGCEGVYIKCLNAIINRIDKC